MKFDQDFIEKVRSSVDLVEFVSQYVELRQKGGSFTGLCPFPDHSEKTPSFFVSQDKQLYNCFGCHKGGNVFHFLRDYSGMNFPEAVEFLAKRSGISLPEKEMGFEAKKKEDLKRSWTQINRMAAVLFHKNIKMNNCPAYVSDYLKQRGLNSEVIEKFRLGFAPDSWDWLRKKLEKVPPEIAEQLGLLKKRKEKQGYYDTFRDRLIFPIFSNLGDVLGFGGRVIREGNPKYLNSPETPLFSKGKILYGLHETAKHVRSQDQVIVVEGYMDLLSLYSSGVKNVAATLGTALTLDHARVLKKLTQNVVVIFDGDRAGQEASERSLGILLSAGLKPRILVLPEGQDPDDFIRSNGVEVFNNRLANASDLFLEVLGRKMKSYRPDPQGKEDIISKMAPILRILPQGALRDLYIREVANILDVESRVLVSKLKGEKDSRINAERKLQTTKKYSNFNKIKKSEISKAELNLLQMALINKSHMEIIEREKVLSKIQSKEVAKILERALALYRQNPSNFDRLASLLASELEDPSVITAGLDERESSLDPENTEKIFLDCVQRVNERDLKHRAQKLKLGLNQEKSPEKLEQFMNIVRNRHGLKVDP